MMELIIKLGEERIPEPAEPVKINFDNIPQWDVDHIASATLKAVKRFLKENEENVQSEHTDKV